MEANGGKWVPINDYVRRRGVSKGTVYRRIRKGELTKRINNGISEVFLTGEELELYEGDISDTAKSEYSPPEMDVEFDSDDAFSIAEQTLRTMVAMHKEVMAEKTRLLKEWQEELEAKTEKIEKLSAELAQKQAIIEERTVEIKELKRALRKLEEAHRENERALNEYRRLIAQREELEHLEDSSREELTQALAEKDRIIDEKERLLEETRRTLTQREDVFRENMKLVNELKNALQEAKQIIAEKDKIIEQLRSEPMDLNGKLASKDQTIAELRALVKTLENQLEIKAHSQYLTGFSEENAPETGSLIQDQLEYIMQSQKLEEMSKDAIKPEEMPMNGEQYLSNSKDEPAKDSGEEK